MRAPLDGSAVAELTANLDGLDDPTDAAAWLRLLRTLFAVGRRDLPLGRVFEGHVDALQIVSRYGTAAQREAAQAAARAGAVFGVWNADLQGEAAAIDVDRRLAGGKAFASGAGVVTHALLSADANDGRRLVLVDLSATPPQIDRSWWRVVGMQRSETHVVRWRGAALPPDAHIGAPGDYVREPWFGGGALRFAAVQAGGVAAVVDQVRDHLVASGRAGDPHQTARLASLYGAAQSAVDAVASAARRWQADDVEGTLAHVAAARVAVYRSGEEALTLAQSGIGLQAMFLDHPLAETLADLTVYLRQPAPDAQRARAGAAVAAGLLSPAL